MYLNIETKVSIIHKMYYYYYYYYKKYLAHLSTKAWNVWRKYRRFTIPHPHCILLLKHNIFGWELKLANIHTLYF